MTKLLNNYEDRVKNFILNMAVHPVIIKKQKKIEPSSPLLTTSAQKNIKKNFSSRRYVTEKERLKEILERKASLDKYLEIIDKSKRKQEIINQKKNKPTLIQPSMRFSSRTDLEKIFDVIKNKKNFSVQQKILKSHLAKLGYKSHSMENENIDEYENEEETEKNDDEFNYNNIVNNTEVLSEEQLYKKNLHDKILQERRNMINKRKILMEIEKLKKEEKKHYKNLNQGINQKTQFIATENLKMFKTSTMNHNIFKKWRNEDEDNQKNIKNQNSLFYETMGSNFPNISKIKNNPMYKKLNSKKKNPIFKKINSADEFNVDNFLKTNNYLNNVNININKFNINKNIYEDNNNRYIKRNKSYSQDRHYNITENRKILKELNITKEIANTNPLLYNLNFTQSKKENNNFISNKEQLNMLKKLAFEKYNNTEDSFYNIDKNKNEHEELRKEENVIIDGKEFRKTDIDKIAGKILQKCNWNENDVNYNSNEGGLMFTNGLTVREFEAKYLL